MKRLLPAIGVASLIATSALAQTTAPSNPPATTPAAPPTSERPMTPPAQSNAPSVTTPMDTKSLTLTEDQAKSWVDKVVYSADGKNLGEVAAFARDGSGKVTEMHADIGGFLGLGETRVRLLPTQFRLDSDRVVLTLTAEEAKALPQIAKK